MYITTIYNHRVKRQLICRSSDCVQCWCLRRLPCPYKNKAKSMHTGWLNFSCFLKETLKTNHVVYADLERIMGFLFVYDQPIRRGRYLWTVFASNRKEAEAQCLLPPPRVLCSCLPRRKLPEEKTKLYICCSSAICSHCLCVCVYFSVESSRSWPKQKKREKLCAWFANTRCNVVHFILDCVKFLVVAFVAICL